MTKQSTNTPQSLRGLIADDSYLMAFQTVTQYRTALLQHADALAAQHAENLGAAAWGQIHTVGDLVRNLMTLDQNAPIFTAFHVTIDGQRRCRTRDITISRERVVDGKWIDSARKDAPHTHIIWAKPHERGQQAKASRELPPLPVPIARMYSQNGYRRASVSAGKGEPLFAADQMRDYARAARSNGGHEEGE